MTSPLHVRLTVWYVGAFSIVLILFSTGVYFFVERTLLERMDANLGVTLQTTSSALGRNSSQSRPVAEALEEPRFPGQIVARVSMRPSGLFLKLSRVAVFGARTTSVLLHTLPILTLKAAGIFGTGTARLFLLCGPTRGGNWLRTPAAQTMKSPALSLDSTFRFPVTFRGAFPRLKAEARTGQSTHR